MDDNRVTELGPAMLPADASVTPEGPLDTATGDFLMARFRSSAALDAAIEKLESAGFDRDALGLPDLDMAPELRTPEQGNDAADTGVEVQQARVLRMAVGGAAAAMIGAVAVAASGGVAAAVAGVGIGAGLVVAGLIHLVSRALGHSKQQSRTRKAAEGKLLLAIRAATDERRERATAIIREVGAELL